MELQLYRRWGLRGPIYQVADTALAIMTDGGVRNIWLSGKHHDAWSLRHRDEFWYLHTASFTVRPGLSFPRLRDAREYLEALFAADPPGPGEAGREVFPTATRRIAPGHHEIDDGKGTYTVIWNEKERHWMMNSPYDRSRLVFPTLREASRYVAGVSW